MVFLIGGLVFLVAFLLTYIFYIKREMINISKQLDEYNDFKTEKKIDVNLINREIEVLAESINRHIKIADELKLKEIKAKEELKEMISNISHDLRTPLTSIIGYVQMIKVKNNDEYRNIEYLNKVESKARDLENMLEDFFTLSVVDNFNYDLKLEYVDINEIVCDTLVGFYEQLERKGIEPNININQVSRVLGEGKSIKRILENLMSNVLKYSSKVVEVELSEDENMVSLIIMNSVQINEKIDTEKIFDKFHKGNDKSRTIKSTGLGLSIVKTLMEKMNGSVCANQINDKLYIICTWNSI